MEWLEILIGMSIAIYGIYYWATSTFDYWSSRGIAGPAPTPFLGNLSDVFFGKSEFGVYLRTLYEKYRDEPMIGIYMCRDPAVVLIDPNLIQDVLIKDFSSFSDRGLKAFEIADPLSQHLVNLEPARWRPLRRQLSPAFTSRKLKKMFYLLLECGEHLEEYLAKLTSNNETVECRELTAKFTTDVIGTCAFGLQMNALADEESEFRKMGREIFIPYWWKIVKIRMRDFVPSLYSFLGPLLAEKKVVDFFMNVMRDTVNYRKKNHVVKHDFIDLVMELRDNPYKVGDIELTDILLTAQLFVFFLAGFETSSTTMSNVLYELAQNQTIQDKLRNEINIELAKTKGELTYEGIKAMKYLDMIFKETLRMYPPGSLLIRKSTAQYTFEDSKITLPEGTIVVIPTFGIHRDSRIYPKPNVFDPERFTDEAIAARHPMTWLPFGDGPRNCIGARFANYQSKVGLIKILQRYKVEVCDKTEIPYVFDPKSFLLAPKNGIHVKISKVD